MAKSYNKSVILSFCPVRRNSLASIPEVLSICCTLSVSGLVSHPENRVSNDEAQVLIVLLLLTPSYRSCIYDNSQLNCRKNDKFKMKRRYFPVSSQVTLKQSSSSSVSSQNGDCGLWSVLCVEIGKHIKITIPGRPR